MSVLKKIVEKKKDKNKKDQNAECWYNNANEKDRKLWNEPEDGGVYEAAHFDHAVANQIAKRQ